MRTTRMLLCALLLGLPTIAVAQSPSNDTNAPSPNAPSDTNAPKRDTSGTSDTTKGEKMKLSQVDTQAIAHQHAVNQLEIDLGKMAQKSGSAPVKAYGRELVRDHMNADRDITAFGKKHGVTQIPADTAMTEADKKEQQDNMSKLRAMKGADFDREFLNMMVADHDREVTKIEADIGIVDNKDLAAKLREIKPVLQKHADDARKLQKPGGATSMREP